MNQTKNIRKFNHIKFIYFGIFSVIGFFVVSRFYPIAHRIEIKTNSVRDGANVDEGIIKILGQAKKATNLYINGKSTSVTKNGEFEEAIALPAGYNIITITAVDKFGKGSSKTMRLNIGENTLDTAMNNKIIINN